MTITEEIEEVAAGTVEVVTSKDMKPSKFSSGHDNWDKSKTFGSERDKQIKCAIAGCVGAKYTLTDEPHNFKEVAIGGQVVTTKGGGWYI